MNILDRFSLAGKCAVVTGGTKGLGKAMAAALADAGAAVALLSRHGEEAAAVAAEIGAETGQKCAGYECDVIDETAVNATVAQILAEFGRIDILVNNAGINVRGSIDSLSLEEFSRVQAVNVTGPWLMCRAVGAHMIERGSGRVINIGSTLSLIALSDRTPYASSKGAILQLSRALALEWAPPRHHCQHSPARALCHRDESAADGGTRKPTKSLLRRFRWGAGVNSKRSKASSSSSPVMRRVI